eukprot:TRINITY_DN6964_c1_g1_i1.p1 TRINITY_DN6964_c1_g1~~TRINITY_DN6964_c1_g1_i1.p1  ORF type:complete len:114 (-),score=4.51 TRINITY_DN6964_c1_g1_i1:381-722(-)
MHSASIFSNKWVECQCSLNSGVFMVRKAKTSPLMIPLNPQCSVEINNTKENSFTLTDGNKKPYTFASDSELDMIEWMTAFLQAIALPNTQEPMVQHEDTEEIIVPHRKPPRPL